MCFSCGGRCRKVIYVLALYLRQGGGAKKKGKKGKTLFCKKRKETAGRSVLHVLSPRFSPFAFFCLLLLSSLILVRLFLHPSPLSPSFRLVAYCLCLCPSPYRSFRGCLCVCVNGSRRAAGPSASRVDVYLRWKSEWSSGGSDLGESRNADLDSSRT
mmetsp:Transcript_32865/g.65079  ORF Transcript_32865/g.65079 Transcript_32865/m.65079 type:complete len:157 (+) Transcript_32865:135-605(+)